MEDIRHHLTCMKPCKTMGYLPCRLQGFLHQQYLLQTHHFWYPFVKCQGCIYQRFGLKM